MKRWISLVGYWLVHTLGIFPVSLKPSTKKEPASFLDQRASWTPWTSSTRAVWIGLSAMAISLYDGYRWLSRSGGAAGYDWNGSNLGMLITQITQMSAVANIISAFCFVLIATTRRREIERLLNTVCSLHFTVFGCTDSPEARSFAYLVVYFVLCSVTSTADTIAAIVSESTNRLTWQLCYQWIMLFTEVILGTIGVYLQSAVEELNRKIKSKFPSVDEWDLKCWEFIPRREEDDRQEGPTRSDVKSALEEYRLAYRTVANIADRMNSAYGCSQLVLILFNQLICLSMAFCFISLLLRSQTKALDAAERGTMIAVGFHCVWCFVRMSVICHSFEIVVKELEVTAHYIATIDASGIDLGSKIELLEFLEEIDARKIRFMASHIFSLDYATLYSLLTGTATYIIIVTQYLSY